MKAFDIPGFIGNDELRTLFFWVHHLPKGSKFVEVGSCFGRSSAAWAEGAPSCEIHCFDRWPDHKMPGEDILSIPVEVRRWYNIPDQWTCVNSLAFFQENLAWASNVYPHKIVDATSIEWDSEISAMWIDAEHKNPSDLEYIRRFLPHIKSGGWIGGHDYSPAFPDVIANAEMLAAEFNSPIEYGSGTTWRVFPK